MYTISMRLSFELDTDIVALKKEAHAIALAYYVNEIYLSTSSKDLLNTFLKECGLTDQDFLKIRSLVYYKKLDEEAALGLAYQHGFESIEDYLADDYLPDTNSVLLH